jgi:ABC-type uncharacterized transport system substrate-binding protein
MRRREFIGLLGGAAAWPLAVRGQQAPMPVRRIAVLTILSESDPEAQARVAAFEQTLEQIGWRDGRDIRIDYRFAVNIEQTRVRAAELVRLSPAVIVTNSTPAVTAVRQETGTIPIVFVQVTDPVGSGFVTSLARPGGNVTGFTTSEFPVSGKWIEMLKEIDPRVGRVAFIFNPRTAPYAEHFLREVSAVPLLFGVEILPSPVVDAAEMERVIDRLAREPNGGLVVLPDVFTTTHRDLIIALVARARLPAIYPFRYFATGGGLMSYGFDTVAVYRQAASYVDRILKGEKPADLPVQAPTKYSLVINLKTAKALGLDIPPTLLARADEVIE